MNEICGIDLLIINKILFTSVKVRGWANRITLFTFCILEFSFSFLEIHFPYSKLNKKRGKDSGSVLLKGKTKRGEK